MRAAERLWMHVLLWPLAAAVVYYVCLRGLAPQQFYCERTAETLPWQSAAGLNVWGAIGLGLIAASVLGVAKAVRVSAAQGWVRALALSVALGVAVVLVTIAYLLPYVHYSCGE